MHGVKFSCWSWFLMTFQMKRACRSLINLSQSICIDKRMLRFKGNENVIKFELLVVIGDPHAGKSGMRQYMPDKHIKRGFKLCVLATSDDNTASQAYAVDFDVYFGSQPGEKQEGLTQRVVIELLEPPDSNAPVLNLDQGYHLFVDNFYTSGIMHLWMMIFLHNIVVCIGSKTIQVSFGPGHIRSWYHQKKSFWISTPAAWKCLGEGRGRHVALDNVSTVSGEILQTVLC